MPLYSYRGMDSDRIYSRFYSMRDDHPETIAINEDGKFLELAKRDIAADHVATPPTKGWPMVSEAAGVHPNQVASEVAFDKKHGVPTEYRNGCPVFTDRGHRSQYLKAHGMIDRNAGYGD